MRRIAGWAALGLLLSPPVSRADVNGEARLLRFPASHGRQLAFTYGGNLYTVASEGGIARKLTSHDGFEMFARYSPDGSLDQTFGASG